MIFLGIAIGAIIGVSMLGWQGFVVGGLIGYLVVEINGLRTRVTGLEQKFKQPSDASRPASAPMQPSRRPPSEPVASAAEPVMVPPTPQPNIPAQPVASAQREESRSVASEHRAPSPASVFDRVVVNAIRGFFTGGNTVVRVGVVILFFGVAFMLKYAAEHARLPIELRLTGTALAAIALLFVGMRVRRKREGYGLTLEGGAIGILYLTIFAAFRLYDLLPGPLVFALLAVVCASSAALALFQNSLALAVLGVSGGFLAPVLASTGGGSHVALFTYYLILNAGILAIAWFKAWRLLNLVGFGFTFVIGTFWGYRYYRHEFFATTEPFLILFFLLYIAVTTLFARRRAPDLRDPVDGTLVFGVPIVGFLLQAALVKDYEYGLAWSALALGAFYLALAWQTLSRRSSKLLAEAFLALGVIFATLTIPLAVDGRWTAAAWAVEGAGVLWIALRQSRTLALIFGLLVQLGAGVMFFSEAKVHGDIALLNSAFIGALLVSFAGIASGFLLHHHRTAIKIDEKSIAILLLAWGLLWWYGGTFFEIERHVTAAYHVPTWLLVIAASTFLQHHVGKRLDWPALRYASLCNLGLLFLALAWAAVSSVKHPFAHFGFIAWPLALASYYVALRRTADLMEQIKILAHAGAFWLLVAVVGWELYWAVGEWLPRSDWSVAVLGLFLAALLMALSALRSKNIWPVGENDFAYLIVGAMPVIVLALGWLLFGGVRQPGNPAPLPYVPLLNPLDVTAMFILVALFAWILRARDLIGAPPDPLFIGLGVAAFAWINAALFRALHHIAGVPYTLNAMIDSVLAQSAVSIFWTVLAFALMLIAIRVHFRYLWLIGAGLLGVVVVKLFAVDLSSTGTVARIVSFVGVGALLLVIGYVAPVPPRTRKQAEVHP